MASYDVPVRPVSVPVNSLLSGLYPGANLLDSYATALLPADSRDVRQLATRLLTRNPVWIRALLRLRDVMVKAFGVKTSSSLLRAAADRKDHISFMRVYQSSASELVLGEDDRHLDFRLSVMVRRVADATVEGDEVVATTVVHCHNLFGRCYLLVISPFHRAVVKNLLRRIHSAH